MNVYCLYSPSGKKYVGVESRTGHRIRTHMRGYELKRKHPPAIAQAIKSFGWEAFQWRYLASNCTPQEAWKLEQFFIRYFGTQERDLGYNRSSGGTHGALGMRHTPESKALIQKTRAWYKPGKEVGAKISLALKGHPGLSDEAQRRAVETRRRNGRYAQSEESNRKRSEKLKGRLAPIKGRILLPGPNNTRIYVRPEQLI